MKKESEKNKFKATENNRNGEFLTQEEYSAAINLYSLKHEKLDEKSAVTLDKLKRKFLGQIKGKDKQEEEDPCVQEEPSSIIHGRNRIDIPLIAPLAGLIGEYSMPCKMRSSESDLTDKQKRLLLNKNDVLCCYC